MQLMARRATPPKVTVFVPVYNRARYVGATIASVLAQSFGDFELLLVDDGSTDESRDVIAAFADPRIRLESNERNLGIPATRNRGLELARGEYLALLDSDDLAHPRRLERQVRFLDAHPRYAEIGTWCGFIDERGSRLHRVRRHAIDSHSIRAEMLFRCPISNRSVMGRLEILRAFPYCSELPVCEDIDVHCRIARVHAIGNLPDVLVYGREHGGRTSSAYHAERAELHGRIMRALLEDLGLRPDAGDLKRHYLLGRRNSDVGFGGAYLEWADAWLARLDQANRRTLHYEPAAFARALGATWARTCWKERKRHGARLSGRLLRKPWAARGLRYLARARWEAFARPDPP